MSAEQERDWLLAALEEIAGGDCTGPNKLFTCNASFAKLPRSKWCAKCVAEAKLTAFQKLQENAR